MACHACVLTWVGVRPNASLRLGFYTWHSSSHGSFEKNFVVGIFGVWIFGLLQPERWPGWGRAWGGAGGPAGGEVHDGGSREEGAEVGRVRQPHGISLARSFGLGGWDPRFWTSGVFSVVPLPQFPSFPRRFGPRPTARFAWLWLKRLLHVCHWQSL